ncbi:MULTISPECIES: Holliday junction resolvase RuvX [unclassified Methylophilus]|jgi:putative holliday junction resolvase|uniref:Holliday junction resolvase RuvX n=1 Tax=unclassified Methylophilus TaxID=2630143 RepID=UPI00188ECAB7|nr:MULTISPECIES: Holliday junction resolvase RuvX [unclassified Methylophilus]MBF5039184.1 Holliday junction resolvase RuvX [Methylophilus sp. 13]MDF0377347.1 Holliday junction resolvase RuvX [Methylophilus sp. YYY-1]BEV08625.1 Holliday junction resolvase RuvX [Methylophilus sp. DW102]
MPDATRLGKQPLNQSHLPITQRRYPDITGTLLAFDFGEKRIGVAVGDTLLKLAHPLLTIEAEENAAKFAQIESLLKEWQPALLVVGLPMSLDGEAHAMTALAQKFAQRLEGRFNLPVVMVDERLSSAEASQSLREAGIRGRAQKQMLDQVAAQTILQSYFDAYHARK